MSAKPQRPNILLILNDDMGYSDIGCYGADVDTPNLDRLAQGGLRYTQFHNTARYCSSRASLRTGHDPHQADVGQTAPYWPLHAPEKTVQKYKGRFDEGWDILRAKRLKRVRKPGILGEESQLSAKEQGLPDLMATFLDVSGSSFPEKIGERPILPHEGASMVPTFEDHPHTREVLYWEHEGNCGIRKGRWNLVCTNESDLLSTKDTTHTEKT